MSAELRALRENPFDLLVALDARLRSVRLDVAVGQTQSWMGLGFRIGAHWITIAREDVREVITPPELTRVPNSKPWLKGVANVRGELLTIVDLGQFLNLPSEESRAKKVLVFNSDRVPAGFLVDEVAGHRNFSPAEQRPELVNPADVHAPYLLGGFVREGQPWWVLSLHKIAQSESFTHAGL